MGLWRVSFSNSAKILINADLSIEYAIGANTQRAMNAVTNTFCAGGNVMGNGTWINIGGNQAVTYGGDQADSSGDGPYDDPDGGRS